MELDSVDRPPFVTERADRISVALGRHQIAFGRFLDVVAVTHPGRHWLVRREACKQSLRLEKVHLGAGVLATNWANHPAAFDMGDQLHAAAGDEHTRDVEES